MSPIFWGDKGGDQFTYRVRVTAGQTTTPKFTYVAGYPPAFIDWGDGDARTASVSTTEYTHAYAVGGEYTVTLIQSNQEKWLQQVDINTDKVIQVVTPIQVFKALTTIIATINTIWIQSLNSWVLTNAMNYLDVSSSGVTGNVINFALPVGFIRIVIKITGITGNCSPIILPASLLWWWLYNTAISGCPDLSVMVSIQSIRVHDCALPEATVDLYLSRCVAREAATTYATPTLSLGGTNAAPSVAGHADEATLVTAGWIVTTTP